MGFCHQKKFSNLHGQVKNLTAENENNEYCQQVMGEATVFKMGVCVCQHHAASDMAGVADKSSETQRGTRNQFDAQMVSISSKAKESTKECLSGSLSVPFRECT